MFGELRNPRWMYLKAILLMGIGLIACAILLIDSPHVRTALLLAVAIWAFCRAYYFAFYVIEHYIDPTYKFAGLAHFVRYLMTPVREGEAPAEPSSNREESAARQEPRPPNEG